MKIEGVRVSEILDSRGEPTIEVTLTAGGVFSASVPRGKSTGRNEAVLLPPEDCAKALRKIAPKLLNRDFRSIASLDKYLICLDGTKNKAKLGGNIILGISIAFTRALAAKNRMEVWEVVRAEFFPKLKRSKKNPLIFSNLINGGAHAKDNLAIQEYMVVVPSRGKMIHAIENLTEFYRRLGDKLSAKSRPALGDEGGYMRNFENSFEPLLVLGEMISSRADYKNFKLALDAAATNFFSGKTYAIDKKNIPAEELRSLYLAYFKRSKRLLSLEDPFAETAPEDFRKLRNVLPKPWIVGDDLTTTDPKLIRKYARGGYINAVIIKPNQIGSVSEACAAIRAAKDLGAKTIVSHRSGETDDPFIIHLARAANADAVKIGAPVRERLAKFNELARLY